MEELKILLQKILNKDLQQIIFIIIPLKDHIGRLVHDDLILLQPQAQLLPRLLGSIDIQQNTA